MNDIKIIIDKEVEEYDSTARRPYYRMRGKPVTEEQAFEIIRRTDNYFRTLDEEEPLDYVGSMNFDNWLIDKHHYPFGYGWIHVDGTVGGNAITQKYPNEDEFLEEWSEKLRAFPYLDLVIAVTMWNELPNDLWCVDEGEEGWRDFESAEYEEDFLDAIEVGVYVHDGTIEIMNPERARAQYEEYAALYESENRDKYRADYYDEHRIVQVDEDYLQRCLEKNGLDVEVWIKENRKMRHWSNEKERIEK